MSEVGEPRRSTHIDKKQATDRGRRDRAQTDEIRFVVACTSNDSFDEVFFFCALVRDGSVGQQCTRLSRLIVLASHQLNEYLPSIQIDDDHPTFLFDWHEGNTIAFVAVADRLNTLQRLHGCERAHHTSRSAHSSTVLSIDSRAAGRRPNPVRRLSI